MCHPFESSGPLSLFGLCLSVPCFCPLSHLVCFSVCSPRFGHRSWPTSSGPWLQRAQGKGGADPLV